MVVDTVVQAIMEETKVERVDSRTSLRLASRLLLVILAPLHLATATRLAEKPPVTRTVSATTLMQAKSAVQQPGHAPTDLSACLMVSAALMAWTQRAVALPQ